MPKDAEVERLIVRFEGDSTKIEKATRRSEKAVTNYSKTVKNQLRDASGRFVSAHKRMQRELAKTGSKLKRLAIRFRMMTPAIKSAVTGLRSITRTLTRLAVVAGAVAIGPAIAFGRFNKAMTESLSIMTATVEQAKRMKQVALELGGVVGPTELAKSYYYLASAGLDAEKSMAALPIVMRFAVAGAFDMATATDLLTDAQTALGIVMDENQRNMELVGDHIVLAAKQANASVQQFAESLTSDAGVAARNFGMELSTTMAILGAYASAGKKGAESGNLMGRATRLVSKAYREHGELFKEYGIEVVDEATGQYVNFIKIIGKMEKAFEKLTAPQVGQALEDLGFEALAQKSILPLIGMTKEMEKWEAAQRSAANTTKNVYQKQMEAFANAMKEVWNQVKIVAIAIGARLAPVLEKAGEVLKTLIQHWGGYDAVLNVIIEQLMRMLVAFERLIPVMTIGIIAVDKLATILERIAQQWDRATEGIYKYIEAMGYFSGLSLLFPKTPLGEVEKGPSKPGLSGFIKEPPTAPSGKGKAVVPGLPDTSDIEKGVEKYYQQLDKALLRYRVYGRGGRSEAISLQHQLQDLEMAGAPQEHLQYLQGQLNIYKGIVLEAEKLTKAEKAREEAVKKGMQRQEDLREKGRRMIEEYMTPLEKLRKKADEINRLWDIGALGKDKLWDPVAVRTYQEAMKAAVKEYEEATKGEKKPGFDRDVGPIKALKWGSAEHISEFAKYQAGREPQAKDTAEAKAQTQRDKQLDETKNIVDETKTGNDLLRQLTERPPIEMTPANLGT